MRLLLVVVALYVNVLFAASPVIHNFQLWGGLKEESDKLLLYWGWTNGLLNVYGPSVDSTTMKRTTLLIDCLGSIEARQAIAMIDKHYRDHPDLWANTLNEQLMRALTVKGGPCEHVTALGQ